MVSLILACNAFLQFWRSNFNGWIKFVHQRFSKTIIDKSMVFLNYDAHYSHISHTSFRRFKRIIDMDETE